MLKWVVTKVVARFAYASNEAKSIPQVRRANAREEVCAEQGCLLQRRGGRGCGREEGRRARRGSVLDEREDVASVGHRRRGRYTAVMRPTGARGAEEGRGRAEVEGRRESELSDGEKD